MRQISLSSSGCANMNVDFGEVGIYKFVTRFNYTAECWTLDIFDSLGDALLTGLMLVPGVDILNAYPTVSEVLGSLYFIEMSTGDYQLSTAMDKGAYLAWYSVAEAELA